MNAQVNPTQANSRARDGFQDGRGLLKGSPHEGPSLLQSGTRAHPALLNHEGQGLFGPGNRLFDDDVYLAQSDEVHRIGGF